MGAVRDAVSRLSESNFGPRSNSGVLIFATLVFSLFFIVVLPLGAIIFYSFSTAFPLRGDFEFTFGHYATLAGDPELLYEITKNTLIFATGATALALFLGFTSALLIGKYFYQSNMQILVLLPYAVPAIALLPGWIRLLGSNGWINRFLMDVFGLSSAPLNLYSLWGMIWVQGLHIAPVAFLLILPSVRSIPAAMEESSFTMGGSKYYTMRKVVLPLVWPSVLSTIIFVFVHTMATVGVPSVLGIRGRLFTFGSAIPFYFLHGTSLNYSQAFAFSVYLTAIAGGFIYYYMRVTEREDRYTTVMGQGRGKPLTYSSGRGWRYLYLGFLVAFVFVGGILPLFTVVYDSLYDGIRLGLDVNELTLKYYVTLVSNDAENIANVYRVYGNTIIVALVVPTSTMFLSVLLAYYNQVLDLSFGRLFSFLGALSLALPGVTKGLGFLTAFIATPLYATIGILIVAFHGQGLPYGMRYAQPAFTKLGRENFEAAVTLGDTALSTFRHIALPLVAGEFRAGWIHVFISSVRNIPVAILLYGAGSETVAIELLLVLTGGSSKIASAMAVTITLMSMVPYFVLQKSKMDQGPVGT